MEYKELQPLTLGVGNASVHSFGVDDDESSRRMGRFEVGGMMNESTESSTRRI
jgi:hypothetical protein